ELGELRRNEAGAELDAEARRVELFALHLAIVHRQLRGRDRELDAAGHDADVLAAVAAGDEFLDVEAGDLAGDAGGQSGGVKGGDRLDAAPPLDQPVPEGA